MFMSLKLQRRPNLVPIYIWFTKSIFASVWNSKLILVTLLWNHRMDRQEFLQIIFNFIQSPKVMKSYNPWFCIRGLINGKQWQTSIHRLTLFLSKLLHTWTKHSKQLSTSFFFWWDLNCVNKFYRYTVTEVWLFDVWFEAFAFVVIWYSAHFIRFGYSLTGGVYKPPYNTYLLELNKKLLQVSHS